MRKALLVTGGTGYVGSVFVDYYARQHPSDNVVVIARSSKPSLQFPPNVDIILGDYGDREKIERTIQRYGVTQVLHMATELNNTESAKNVSKGKTLLEAMQNTGVDQLVYSSSFMVYQSPGVGSGGRLAEDSQTKLPSLESYAESKLAVETMISDRKDWKSVILRYGIVIGSSANHRFGDARQSQGILSTYLNAARHSVAIDMPDDGSAARDYIDVQDVAGATDDALMFIGRQKSPGTTVLNVGSGQTQSINQLIHIVERVAGVSIQINRSPNPPGVPVSFLDTALIQKTLGWEPKFSFEQSVSNSWRFLIDRKPAS